MMNKTTLFLATAIAQCAFAQVGIYKSDAELPEDFPHSSAILDVRSDSKGLIAPTVVLTSYGDSTTIVNPKKGLVVYNSGSQIPSGYYYWDGLQWYSWSNDSSLDQTSVSDISVVTLGYIPNGTGASSPATFNYNAITATKVKCITYQPYANSNAHSYCAYDLRDSAGNPVGVNWNDSFRMAKQIGGYLVTATSTAEWEAVRDGLLNISDANHLNKHHSWLGFNKVTYSGNPTQFTWITGERSLVNWGTLTGGNQNGNSAFQFNFLAKEPNNLNGTEGCVHVLYYGDSRNFVSSTTARQWNDINCKNTEDVGDVTLRKAAYLMVEFQK